jgi:hypothetical protein
VPYKTEDTWQFRDGKIRPLIDIRALYTVGARYPVLLLTQLVTEITSKNIKRSLKD